MDCRFEEKDNRDVIRQLKEHKPTLLGMDAARRSAVCIPLIETEKGYEVLFEVRSEKIDRQPGDICFPGGMAEQNEAPLETAMRETAEELLIRKEQIRLLGLMDVLYTGNLLIFPYTVILQNYHGTYSTDEVAEVFTVPLEHFLQNEPECYTSTVRVIPADDFPYDRIYGGKQYKWRKRTEDVFFYRYGKYDIWGLTAKIVKSFAETARDISKNSGSF